MRKACYINLILQKIRLLNAAAKIAEKISSLLKKDYVNLGLEKKKAMALQDGLAGYIKIVRYCYFALPIRTVLLLN